MYDGVLFNGLLEGLINGPCIEECWEEERSTAKNYHPVNLLSAVTKVFEKLVNNRIVDNLEICGLFSFPVWF